MFSEPRITVLMCRAAVFTLSMFVLVAQADLVVIVHPANNVALDKATLKKIFMGRTKTFPDGRVAKPVDLDEGDVKKAFLDIYLQKNQGSLDSYWARMIFTGSGTPPMSYASQQEVKRVVAADKGAIGYIDSSLLDDSVKVLLVR